MGRPAGWGAGRAGPKGGRVVASRHRPATRRGTGIVVTAANRDRANEALPFVLLEAAAKKLADDVAGFTKLFDEDPPTYKRPPTLPVAGNTLDIAQGGHKTLLAWAKEYGAEGLHEVKMLNQPILHITDPALAKDLMFDRFDTFPDRGVSAMAKFFREDQAAFVNTSGKQWMAYRKMGTAAVNGSALDRLAGKVAERSEALVARWAAKASAGGGTVEVDVDDASQAVTLEVIHEALFSEQLDVIDEEPGAVALKRSFRRFNVVNQDLLNDFLQLYQRFDTPEVQQREMHRRRLRAHFDARADAREAAIAAQGAKAVPQDLLTALLTARDPVTGAPLSRDDVNLTLTEMMVAGHDTTAATVACMLSMLAANPAVLAEVRAEVDAVVDAEGGALPRTVAQTAALKKTEDAMKEAMRLYPAVLIVVRKADEGVSGELTNVKGGATSGGKTFKVPSGAGMWISPYVMGRLPQHWGGDAADVAAYRPARFAEAEAAGTSLDAYMPFGGGPRVCLGSRFAMLEGKVLAAAIIRNFDLELTPALKERMKAEGGELPISYAAGLMSFPEPLRLRVTPRRRKVGSKPQPTAAAGAR